MEHLIPEEKDRVELLRWIATLLARPQVKMLYGVLLISETQGVGKGTLAEKILAPIVGLHNCSFPEEREVVDSNFNYWKHHKRLAVCHEIYQGQSWKAYNMLKSTITDKYITIKKKYHDEYELENWLHVFACSNSVVPMKISLDDRRWLVPMVTEEKQPTEYWVELNRWLASDGLGIILHWANEFLKENKPVVGGADAPMTDRKTQLARDAFTPGQELIFNLAKRVAAEKKQIILVVSALQGFIKDHLFDGKQNDRIDKPSAIRKACVAAGLREPVRHGKGRQQRYEVGGQSTYIVANFEIGPDKTWAELKGRQWRTDHQYETKVELKVVDDPLY